MITQFGTRYRLDTSGFFERQTQDVLVEPTAETPFVKYSADENILMIKGNSMRPAIHLFYEEVIGRVRAHLNEGRELDVVLFFNMINPSTAKVLFDLLKFMRLKQMSGVPVHITWCSEASNLEMQQTGEDFAEIYAMDFKFLTI